MARLLQLTSAGLLILSLGLHWAVLQSVAWTTMLVERTQTASLAQAVRTTFDGQHTCKLCNAVAAGQHAEKKSESSLKLVKLEAGAPAGVAAYISPPRPSLPSVPDVAAGPLRTERPALLPPRFALA